MQAGANGHNVQPYASMAGKLDQRLLQALQVMGFENMTPVQHRVLTTLPSWRSDCLVQAKTGTGKTLGFLLPTLHHIIRTPSTKRGNVAIMIITPTRELAQQIKKECDQLTSQLPKPLQCHLAVGGTGRNAALNRFLNGEPSILVATPGRLKDYLSEEETTFRFQGLQTVILDEADTMLESGFLADVKKILTLIPPKSTGWQGMCFSATIPPRVKDVVDVVLRPGYTSISTIEENEVPTIDRVPQFAVIMPSTADTFNTLAALLAFECQSNTKIIVFGVTANMVALFAKVFSQRLTHLKVFEIHSRLTQTARTRTTTEFKDTASGVMFASDVVGRGLDFPNVDLVIQVGLPSSADQYVHRVGRTGRAGNDGRAVILLTEGERFFLKRNPALPIKRHPHEEELVKSAASYAPSVIEAMYKVDETTKQRAYSSFIGFFAGSGHMKALQLDKPGLVALANDLAMRGMACPEPPPMDKKVIGKMGLKGVPGFNYARAGDLGNEQAPHRPRQDNDQRRAPKQDAPQNGFNRHGWGSGKTAGGSGGGTRGGGGRRRGNGNKPHGL